jgi:hypothetical protein
MCVDEISTVEVRPGTGAAADRLVILIALVAEGEVVHGSLGGAHEAERAIERVGDDLRRLDVAGDDSRRIARAQHAAGGNDDLERLQAALVHGDVVVHQRAEDIEHGRLAHRRGRVEVAVLLRRGAREIDDGAAGLTIDVDAHLDDGTVVELVGEAAGLEHAEHRRTCSSALSWTCRM